MKGRYGLEWNINYQRPCWEGSRGPTGNYEQVLMIQRCDLKNSFSA